MKFLLNILLVGVLAILSGCRPALSKFSDEPVRTPEQWRQWKAKHKPNEPIKSLVCSGSGISRLLIYLDGTERLAAVETYDQSSAVWAAPYRVAHPELQNLPVWSNGHGHDQVETLLSLVNPPEIILRLDMPGMGIPSAELERRTGIPTIQISYGDLLEDRETLFGSLRFLGEILGQSGRAEEIIHFFEREIVELQQRTSDIPSTSNPEVYIGGISYRGAHGLNSTTQNFPPLRWLHTKNVADGLSTVGTESGNHGQAVHVMVPREQLTAWNPEFLFIDMATLALPSNNAVEELRTVPLYQSLDAVKEGRCYLLLPNSSYNVNFGSQLANAWFIGSVLYPDRFADIDPKKKAKEIFTFLTGDSVIDQIDRHMPGQIFRQIQ